MQKWLALTILVCLLAACERLDSGSPPAFVGTPHWVAVSATQISLSWQAGTDDKNDASELAYGIWYAKDNETLSLDGTPQVITSEGALAYNLVGLQADREYQVVVRARDRGLAYSSNTNSIAPKTSASGSGLFKAEVTHDRSDDINGLLAGPIFTTDRDALGVISGSNIHWYESDSAGALSLSSNRITLSENILEAHIARVRESESYGDLYVLTATTLTYFKASGQAQYANGTTPFNQVPQAGTLAFSDLNDDTHLDISFLNAQNEAFISLGDGAGAFVDRPSISLGNFSHHLLFADINEDNLLDLITFGTDGIKTMQADNSDDNLTYAAEVLVDAFARDSGKTTRLLAGDGNNDGYIDLYAFVHDAGNDETLLRVYLGKQADGGFETASETSYSGSPYSQPLVVNFDGSAGDDLLFNHDAANNVAAYYGSTGTFQSLGGYFGGDGTIHQKAVADFDGDGKADLVVGSNDSNKFSLLLRL